MFSNKGVYALLLGSGISRTSGIPTGWDIVMDLTKKLAKLNDDECTPSPEEWFRKKYKEEPDYSSILAKLANTPSERVALLRQYFEPTAEEEELRLKKPTKSHRSIAKLVKQGYLKVVITTNFDRLLETALQEEGLNPIIIKHPNDIDGAMPLVHSDFTLIKINGDYLDTRFLNTKEELSSYEDKLNEYILRIFNEYGLISCGWSAKWDNGLMNLLRQSSSFRFCNYWTYLGECENELSELANYRKGMILKIKDADSFFSEISTKIATLESMNNNHPLNADIAVARLKSYIVKDEGKILLHDLIYDQQEDVYSKVRSFLDSGLSPNRENLKPIIDYYNSSLEIILPLVVNGAFWCKTEHHEMLVAVISRMAEPFPSNSGSNYPDTIEFYRIPALLLLYAIGIASVKTNNYKLLFSCFHIKIHEYDISYSDQIFMLQKFHQNIVNDKLMNEILSTNKDTPTSNYVYGQLRQYFKRLIVSEREYEDIFDVFELMLSLNYIHLEANKYGNEWFPLGRYFGGYHRRNNTVFKGLMEDADVLKDQWLPLKAGMFSGRYEKFMETKRKFDKFLKKTD